MSARQVGTYRQCFSQWDEQVLDNVTLPLLHQLVKYLHKFTQLLMGVFFLYSLSVIVSIILVTTEMYFFGTIGRISCHYRSGFLSPPSLPSTRIFWATSTKIGRVVSPRRCTLVLCPETGTIRLSTYPYPSSRCIARMISRSDRFRASAMALIPCQSKPFFRLMTDIK